jgi:tRNA A-37 threonylcarbamoyl transferase component Bud32
VTHDERGGHDPTLGFQLATRAGLPTFSDLPWDRPLAAWRSGRVVEVPRGMGRHVVRFVSYGDRLYALKELDDDDARHEYRLLRDMAAEGVPVVQAVGLVNRAGRHDHLPAVLITRYLEFSLPYRLLFTGHVTPDLRTHLMDALAGLLVRVHLAGFVWGDCSLSNTLFRRDAGTLAAHLVDADTAEAHGALTDVQRAQDIDIAKLNIAGELIELEARNGGLPSELRPMETATEIVRRYQGLYDAVTREEVFGPLESYRIEERVRALNGSAST